MPNLRPISQKQFLVSLSGLPEIYFTKATAAQESREVIEYTDGQTGTVYKMPGFSSRENVTLSKPFHPDQDKALVDWYNGQKAKNYPDGKFTVSITPVSADRVASLFGDGKNTIVLTGCEVVSFKFPEVDRMSSGLAVLELELLFDDFSMQ